MYLLIFSGRKAGKCLALCEFT